MQGSRVDSGALNGVICLLLGVAIAAVSCVVCYEAIYNMLLCAGGGGCAIVFAFAPMVAMFVLLPLGLFGMIGFFLIRKHLDQIGKKNLAQVKLASWLLITPWISFSIIIIFDIVYNIVAFSSK